MDIKIGNIIRIYDTYIIIVEIKSGKSSVEVITATYIKSCNIFANFLTMSY